MSISAIELEKVLSSFLVDRDNDTTGGYANNITAAAMAIANAINRHADAIENLVEVLETTKGK